MHIASRALARPRYALHEETKNAIIGGKRMSKVRIAVGLIVGLALAAALRSSRAQAPELDLLIKGGHVLDPKNGIDRLMDIRHPAGEDRARRRRDSRERR